MLRVLRENAQSWMLKGILILVAVTFVSWGGYSLIREKNATYAARVNGTDIGINDFRAHYDRVIKQYRDALGPAFSEKMIEELKLKENILDQLISQALIFQEAKRLGIRVTDDEFKQSYESTPAFQVEGQFDQGLFDRVLRDNGLTPDQFERMQRDDLMISKVKALIQLNGGMVSEDEARNTYLFENERINLNFLKIDPNALKGQVEANEIEVKDYYQKHQSEFKTPIFIQVQYLLFRPTDLEGKIQVSSEEIKRIYDLQKDRLKIPKQARVREILIKSDPKDPTEKTAQQKKKAEEILEKAKKTKDFASLAKQVSESNSAAKGGDVGLVQKGTVGEPIESSLFSMKAGEVSNLITVPGGFYIFKVEEVKEEKEKSLDEVKDQIFQLLKKEKAKKEASRVAEDAFYSFFRSKDLEQYAKDKNIPIKTTGFFKEGEEVPEIGRDPSFYSNAFSLKVGDISSVINVTSNFCILKLLNKKESRIPPFEEVKEEAKKKVIAAKAEEKARQVANEILDQIQKGKTFREAAQGKGLQVEESGYFNRTAGVIPKIGPAAEWMRTLSPLTEKNPTPKEVLQTKEGFFVVKLLSVESADPAKFQAVKQDIEKRLTSQKQQEFFQNWLDQLQAKAKIKKNKDLL
jgi:peptidyl-prolyl cis-trans isomerase D